MANIPSESGAIENRRGVGIGHENYTTDEEVNALWRIAQGMEPARNPEDVVRLTIGSGPVLAEAVTSINAEVVKVQPDNPGDAVL